MTRVTAISVRGNLLVFATVCDTPRKFTLLKSGSKIFELNGSDQAETKQLYRELDHFVRKLGDPQLTMRKVSYNGKVQARLTTMKAEDILRLARPDTECLSTSTVDSRIKGNDHLLPDPSPSLRGALKVMQKEAIKVAACRLLSSRENPEESVD